MPPTNLAPNPRITYITAPDGTVYEVGARLEAHKLARHSDVNFKTNLLVKGSVPSWDPAQINPDLTVGGWTSGPVKSPDEVAVSETEPTSPLVEWWVKPVAPAVPPAAPKGVWDFTFKTAADLDTFTYRADEMDPIGGPANVQFTDLTPEPCFEAPIPEMTGSPSKSYIAAHSLEPILQPFAGQSVKHQIEYEVVKAAAGTASMNALMRDSGIVAASDQPVLVNMDPPTGKQIYTSSAFALKVPIGTAPSEELYYNATTATDWKLRIYAWRLLDAATDLPLGLPPGTRAIGVPEEGSSVELYYRPAPGEPFIPVSLGLPEVYAHDGSTGDPPAVPDTHRLWVDTSQSVSVAAAI